MYYLKGFIYLLGHLNIFNINNFSLNIGSKLTPLEVLANMDTPPPPTTDNNYF